MTIRSSRPLLNVDDCARSLAFYRDLLGFTVVDTFEANGSVAWARLSAGTAELMLNQRPVTSSERQARAPYTGIVLYFEVQSVHALKRDLERKGATPSDPEPQAYGVDEMYLRDPDGYELAFTSPSDLTQRR